MPVRSAKVFSMGMDSAPMKADKTSSTVTADWTPFEPRGAMRSKARIDNERTDHTISTSLVSVSAPCRRLRLYQFLLADNSGQLKCRPGIAGKIHLRDIVVCPS